jgi:hypothetical protein
MSRRCEARDFDGLVITCAAHFAASLQFHIGMHGSYRSLNGEPAKDNTRSSTEAKTSSGTWRATRPMLTGSRRLSMTRMSLADGGWLNVGVVARHVGSDRSSPRHA